MWTRKHRTILISVVCVCFLSSCSTALAVAPTITSISKNNGPDKGGTSVKVTGTGFISGSKVKFGTVEATTVQETETSIKATSPVGYGSELVNISVTNSNGTSAPVSKDQFAYDPIPASPWLGLNENSTSDSASHEWLGPANEFSQHNIDYDRSFEIVSGELPSEREPDSGSSETYFESRLKADYEYGMTPIGPIDYKGYGRTGYGYIPDPEFPQTRTKKEEEEGKNSIKGYVEGFTKTASAILKLVSEKYPGMQVLFEPLNEPWGYTTPQFNGAEYANIIAELLPAVKKAGIPLSDIYVAATGWDCTKIECGGENPERPNCQKEGRDLCGCEKGGKINCNENDWVTAMYEAQPGLAKEIQGWYMHPYGPPSGTKEGDSSGIESLPFVQAKMTSGQNNIIVSEVGYCDKETYEGAKECDNGLTNSEVEKEMPEMLAHAKLYHEEGWLRALIIYSRSAFGWAMQEYPSKALTKGGEAFVTFANTYGQTWMIPAVPGPAGAKSADLAGVSCASAEVCIAAGHYVNSSSVEVPLAEKWNGTEWTLKEPKTPSGAKSTSLAGVSCPSAEVCITAGHYVNSSSVEAPLAEKWNGTEWELKEPKTPSGAKSTALAGVSCTSATVCIAAGHYVNSSSVEAPLAEKWNGTEWTIQTTAVSKEVSHSKLSGIVCTLGEACVGVGSDVTSTGIEVSLVESYVAHAPYVATEAAANVDGTEATLHGIVDPEGQATIYHFEYGKTTSYGTSLPVPSVEFRGDSSSDLEVENAITGLEPEVTYHFRISATNNVSTAYGSDHTFTTTPQWSLLEPAGPAEAKYATLHSISCASSIACISVGRYKKSSGGLLTLAEQWNGAEWITQSTSNPSGAVESLLSGVSCSSSTACTAVGVYEKTVGTPLTLAERWNGMEWKIQETPNPTEGDHGLIGVSCASASFCMAVGSGRSSTNEDKSYAERWNGTEWTLQSMPSGEWSEVDIEAISCTSSSECTAVGRAHEGPRTEGDHYNIVEHWNGTEWKIETVPFGSSAEETFSELDGISCSTSTNCTAVGRYLPEVSEALTLTGESTLALHWNGTEWTHQSTPNPSSFYESTLSGVSCFSGSACMAVGEYEGSVGVKSALAEYWNGTSWTLQHIPTPTGAKQGSLFGAACVSAAICTTAGSYETSTSTTKMFVDKYN
jgi:hypothetical protein